MYSKIKLCVRESCHLVTSHENGNSTKDKPFNLATSSSSMETDNTIFTSISGVFQGECLSPFLFSMFINDLCEFLQGTDGVGVVLEELFLTALLFADDMVILSQSRDGLQKGLNALKDYCDKWGLEVNIKKTKCMAFKKGGRIGKLDKWTYNGKELETVGAFQYLGFVFGSSGKFAKAFENIKNQSYKALFSMKSLLYQYPESSVTTQLHLFNTLVLPVLNYGCEIWGFAEADKLDRLYLGFLKNVLYVRTSTPSAFVYKETGTLPLITHRLLRIFKFWLKVVNLPDTSLVKHIYNLLIKDNEDGEDSTNWAYLVKQMLNTYGLGFIWNQQNFTDRNDKILISVFKRRIDDVHMQYINAEIGNVSNSRLYKYLNSSFVNNDYLFNIKEKYIRIALTKIRLGSHNLMIERGRWMKLEVIDRECTRCGKLEDELHAITECKLFSIWRKKYLPRWLYTKPSMYKLITFLDNSKDRETRRFGLFCYKIINYIQKYIV